MSYQLTLEPLGATIEVEEGQTILDAALRQGIYIPHACGHGLCGTCKVTIESGDVDHGAANPFALMDFERDDGKTLMCQRSPKAPAHKLHLVLCMTSPKHISKAISLGTRPICVAHPP